MTPLTTTVCTNNSQPLKVIKATSRKGLGAPIVISSIKKIEATGTSAVRPLKDATQPVQVLLARKVVGDVAAQNNQILTPSLSRSEGVMLKRCNDLVKKSNEELVNKSLTTVTTEELIKKFRIPKGIALTPKFSANIVVGNKISDTTTRPSTSLVTPPLTANEDTDNSSGLVEYIEEVYEEEEEKDEMQIEEIEEIDDFQEYQEIEQQEDEIEEIDLIEEVGPSEHQDLLMSGECDDFVEATNNDSNILLASCQVQSNNATSSSIPQIIQAIQPNGTIACFQLPPNTIILQSPDGSLLATTAPHPTKHGHQQIIAIQDLNSQLSDVINLPPSNPAVVNSPALQSSATVVLAPGNSVVPVITASGESPASPGIDHPSSNAAIITSNESLIKAQHEQILA